MRKGDSILIFQTLLSTFDFNCRLEYPAVATFGFKKRVLHRAQTVDIAMPEFGFADQGTFVQHTLKDLKINKYVPYT